MGFEVTYKYHERLEGGKYNTEETKELKKRVGKAFDDLPLEKLAAVVMGQLARRDIWIIDVDITEFVKKNIKFKESADGKGIVIKGKRFSFNASAELVAEEIDVVDVDEYGEDVVHKPKPSGGVNLAPQARKPLKFMVFDPPSELRSDVKGMAFTIGNRYAVYDAKEHVIGTKGETPLYGELLLIRDDRGKEVNVSDRYFVQAQNLMGNFTEDGKGSGGNDPRLSFAGELTTIQSPQQNEVPAQYQNIPLDDGGIPENYMAMPDFGRKIK